jgi:hypothetical protein
MIVRADGDGSLLLITQPDHAALSAALISAWNPRALPRAARETVLLAIEQHDNGWHEVDDVPRLNPGTRKPYDFQAATTEMKLAIWPRGVDRLAQQSPMAAALVAQHGLTIHAHRRYDVPWRGFFSYLEARRDDLLGACGATDRDSRDAFARDYDLLFLGDLLSLVYCDRWTDPMDERTYHIELKQGTVLAISPDPFDGGRVRFDIPARAIPDREYASDGDLESAWRQAREVTLHGTARGD